MARPPRDESGAGVFHWNIALVSAIIRRQRSHPMKTTLLLPMLAFGLTLTGGAAVHAMPVTALEQAAPAAATQVYHRGRPHRRARVTVSPRRYYGEPVASFADYSHY